MTSIDNPFLTPLTKSSSTVQDTLLLGEEIGKWLSTLSPQPVVFIGELGAGKTTLIKGIIHHLAGLPYDQITSPTFQYASLFDSSPSISHCDLWRLSGEDEFCDLGLNDLLEKNWCFIEWPDRIDSLLPESTLAIFCQWQKESQRTYTFFLPYKKYILSELKN